MRQEFEKPKSWNEKLEMMKADGLTPLDLTYQNAYKYMDNHDCFGTSPMFYFKKNFKKWYVKDYLEGLEADRQDAELKAIVDARRDELKAARDKRNKTNKQRRKNYKTQVSPGSLSNNRLWAS